MTSVLTHLTMSLDGYIATDTDEVGALFEWYDAGEWEVQSHHPDIRFHLDEVGAGWMRSLMTDVGALVCGRRLFDITDGWGDRHPIGAPVVVVTHHPPDEAARWPRTTFVDDIGPAIATARQLAGDRDVVIASAEIAGEALDLGLVDEVAVSLVPLLMGSGKAYFGSVARGSIQLEDPLVTPGTQATHLRYRVRR